MLVEFNFRETSERHEVQNEMIAVSQSFMVDVPFKNEQESLYFQKTRSRAISGVKTLGFAWVFKPDNTRLLVFWTAAKTLNI